MKPNNQPIGTLVPSGGERRDTPERKSTEPEVITLADDSPIKQVAPLRNMIAIPKNIVRRMPLAIINKRKGEANKKEWMAYRAGISQKPVSSPSAVSTTPTTGPFDLLLMDSNGNIKPEFLNAKMMGAIPDQRLTPPKTMPCNAKVNDLQAESVRRKYNKRKGVQVHVTNCKKPRPVSPVHQSITLVRVGKGQSILTTAASPPPPPEVREPIVVGLLEKKMPTDAEKKRDDPEPKAESTTQQSQSVRPFPKKKWNMEWSSMPDTVTATSTKSPNKPTTATVSDKFRDEDAKSSNTPPARAEPASTAVDINKNAEAATLPVPEETPPCSNKIDSTTINKVIQMYVEYNTGVMKKCKAGESQSSNPKKKASSSDYTIQDAKAYFDLVFKPRLLQLRNLEISAKFQSTFTRDALIMLTHQDDEVCCENCGMSNFEFWCPCRVSREGERLIANVAKLFEDKLHHIEFARQEITKMFQAKKKLQNQDSKSCKDKKAKSKKAKSDDDDDFVVRPSKSKKLTVVLRGKHFLRPRALPSRKSKKSKD